MGRHIINRNGGPKGEIRRPCSEDFDYIYQAALEPSNKKGKVQEPFLKTLNALCGGARVTANPEEFLIIKEQLACFFSLMETLDKRRQYALKHRLGLFGAPDSTLKEIGANFNVSKERARGLFNTAIWTLCRKYHIKGNERFPVITEVSDFPDLLEILGRRGKL